MRLDNLIPYLDKWVDKQKPNTKKSYRNSLNNLARYFSDKDLTAMAISEYDGPNHDRRVLRRMLNLAHDLGLIDRQFKVVVQKEKQRDRYLVAEETDLLIETCTDPELRLAIQIAVWTGLRKNNILSLRWDQINFQKKEIRVVVKGDKPSVKPLSTELCEILNTYRIKSGKISDRVFGEGLFIDRKFKRLCRMLGWDDVVFHTLRHSFASRLVELGIHIVTIQDLLDHASITTTNRYTHVDDSLRRDAINRLSKGGGAIAEARNNL